MSSDEHNWSKTAHVCRVCFGRVLVRETFGGGRVYQCACCGAEAQGENESVICACGIKLKTKIDAGIRCVPNEQKTPDCVSEIVAAQVVPV